MIDNSYPACDGWVLSGGEGSRMGGQDKGLISFNQYPLAWQVAQRLAAQVQQVRINANRNLSVYRTWPWSVHTDDTDLPAFGGPMVGILTGLRHSQAPWLQIAACDVPYLPAYLTAQLFAAIASKQATVAVPVTKQDHDQTLWHHWTSALIASNCAADLELAIQAGERRLGRWLTQQRWIAVMFDGTNEAAMFTNINSPINWP